MISLRRDFRLVPLVVLASAALLALKTTALLMDGGFALGGGSRPAHAQDLGSDAARASARDDAAAKEIVPKVPWLPDALGSPDYTGEIGGTKPAGNGPASPTASASPPATDAGSGAKGSSAPAGSAKPDGDKVKAKQPGAIDLDRPRSSSGERAVLESLNQRRQELDARARDLDMRESLLAAAEKRIEARVGELKALEARLNTDAHKRDEAEASQFKGLVVMYENMKPKDAAKIFDRLDLRILIDVVGQMNPRKMSDILGQMSPEAAERLTTEIARRAGSIPTESAPAVGDLPKIEGKPNGM